MNGTGIFLCNFSGMIKNVLPSLRQRAGPQRICSRQKASAAALPVTPSRKPRMCGEKMDYDEAGMEMQGSPPRMRGKAADTDNLLQSTRITPACAGKRPAPPAQLPLLKDHPRVCGEKDERIAQSDELAGSPPRMRGKAGAHSPAL